ncbi:hypothetical protein GCM10010275_11640 [Streptomyces litmocidini]|nr:hypothetical protein GCM10010275_11640 [Streptomyces litmocidini]
MRGRRRARRPGLLHPPVRHPGRRRSGPGRRPPPGAAACRRCRRRGPAAWTGGAPLSPAATTRCTYPFLGVTAHGRGGVLADADALGTAFYAPGLAIIAPDRIRPAPRPSEYRISSERARGLK